MFVFDIILRVYDIFFINIYYIIIKDKNMSDHSVLNNTPSLHESCSSDTSILSVENDLLQKSSTCSSKSLLSQANPNYSSLITILTWNSQSENIVKIEPLTINHCKCITF